jgi:O-antigen ligase
MDTLLIALLMLAPTIQYRVEVGPASFMLLEPVTLAVAAILVLRQLWRRGSIYVLRDPMSGLLVALCGWCVLSTLWSSHLTRSLSAARDWIVPTIGYIVLLSSARRGWRRQVTIFVAILSLQALIGVYQHATDSSRPFVTALAAYKTGFSVSPDTAQLQAVSFAVGLFTHPNAFAIYLFFGLPLLIAWPARGWRRLPQWALVALVSVCLYWTFAKASLVVMAAALCWYGLQRLVRSRLLLALLTGLGVLGGALLAVTLSRLLPGVFLDTFYWRAGLWATGLQVIAREPWILLTGDGVIVFGQVAYYGQPHNVYIYLLLENGLPGLVWALAALGLIWRQGSYGRRTGLFAREPRLIALWTAQIGFFVIGLVESNLQGVEGRMLFLIVYACFNGLLREVWAEMAPAPAKDRPGYGSATAPRPRLV